MQVTKEGEPTDLSTMGGRFRFHFAPWWRLAWFLLAIAWCAVLNALLLRDPEHLAWLGPISVIPILAFVLAMFWRGRSPTSRRE